MSSFSDQTVWITGASSGIGEALARTIAAQGGRLLLSARRVERLRALADELPGEHRVLPLDLADPVAIAAAAAQAGSVDVLINNAGVSQRSLAADASMDSVRRIMEVNFFGAVDRTQRVLPAKLLPRAIPR